MMLLRSSYYLRLLDVMASLYPLEADVRRIAIAMGVAAEKLHWMGSREDWWDSLLSHIDRAQQQAELISFVLNEVPDNLALRVMIPSLEDGSAYITIADPKPAGTKSAARKTIRILSLYDDDDDQEFVLPLLSELRSLNSLPTIELDTMPIIPGSLSVKDARLRQLAKASIVLLFITRRFFENVDNQCWSLTLDALRLGKPAVPLLMEECPWGRIRILEGVKPLPGDGQFISKWEDRGEGFRQIAEELSRIVQHGEESKK